MLTVSRLNLVSALTSSSSSNSTVAAAAPSCFRLYSTTSYTYSDGQVLGSLGGATADFDTTAGLSTTTGLFTAPTAGYYQFSWKARMADGSSNQLSLQFGVNGTMDETPIWIPNDVANRHCASASTVRKLNGGDKVGVYAKFAQNSITSFEFAGFMLK